jgi:hypothetical protein
MHRDAASTACLCVCALTISLVTLAAFGQDATSFTLCHTYVGGGTVYTSKPVPSWGDQRTWLAPFQGSSRKSTVRRAADGA